MTVKQILQDAIIFTGKPELLSLTTFDSNSETSPTTEQQSDIDLYLRCFNYIYIEISANYINLLEKETITFTDNKFNYSSLTKDIIKVKSLKVRNKPVKYHLFPTYIEAEVQSAVIVYAYLPSDFAITDTVNLFGGQVLPQVMAYGIAREWSLINGDFADADVWETRFKSGIMALTQNNNKRIPARRFI